MAPMHRSPDGGHEACRGRAIVPRSNLVEDPWEVPGDARLGLSHEPGEPTRNAMPVFVRFVGPFAYSAICFRTIWAGKGDQSESTMPHRAGSVPGATTAKFTFLRNAGPTQPQTRILYSPICLFLTAVVTGIGTDRMLAARLHGPGPPLRVGGNPLWSMLSRLSHSTQKWGFHAISQR